MTPTRFFLAAALTLLPVSALHAQEYKAGALKITQPWTRVGPAAAKVGGGFMSITNTGTEPDTLVGGSAVVSDKLEVHEMAMKDGVMTMRELKPGLVIQPGATVELKPGSFHVMFIDLKQQPEAGKPIKGTLVFEKAGKVDIEYRVEPFGTRTPGDGGQAMPGHQGHHK